MSLQLEEEMETQNKKSRLLNRILSKYKECNEKNFLLISINHLQTYEKFLKKLEEKVTDAFPNRLEYQKFEVAKLFIDKIHLLEFSLDPSFQGYNLHEVKITPPLDAFYMTPDIKEARRIRFCRNIEKGDVLHLQVLEESATEYKFLVINKYNDNERVVDYSIHAFMVNSYQLEKLPRPMQISDYIRAGVLGKLKMEGNVFSKLLVTLNDNLVNEKHKGLKLGLIFKSQIPFYPEDISSHSKYLNYMKTEKISDDSEEVMKLMTSVGVDTHKIYSFEDSADGKKLGKPKEMDSETLELKMMDDSMNLIKEAEKQILQGADFKSVIPLADEALKIYPQNDAAYAIRGQLYNRLFIDENDPDFVINALSDCEKSLEINPYNLTATRVYLTILILSAELYKEEGNVAKAAEIDSILQRCKPICDVSRLMAEGSGENKCKQSSTEEPERACTPMDLSD